MREIWVNYHALKTGQTQVVKLSDPHRGIGVGEEGYAKYVSSTYVADMRARIKDLTEQVERLQAEAMREVAQAQATFRELEGWVKGITA